MCFGGFSTAERQSIHNRCSCHVCFALVVVKSYCCACVIQYMLVPSLLQAQRCTTFCFKPKLPDCDSQSTIADCSRFSLPVGHGRDPEPSWQWPQPSFSTSHGMQCQCERMDGLGYGFLGFLEGGRVDSASWR